MNLDEYTGCDATALSELLLNKKVTAAELAELALTAIERVNPKLNAVIESFAERADRQFLKTLPDGPFTGVPMLNKDISCAEKGVTIEMGSELTRGYIPTEDSTIFARLRNAGLVNLGRTTTPEFGLAGVTESIIAGITRNPWDTDRTPGGSSGGSCAMVAAGVVPIASASDGGGSIRSPASHCGLVGLKPTRGRIPVGPGRAESNNGLGIAFAVTRSVRDCAALLEALHGPAPGDPYGIAPPSGPFLNELQHQSQPLRIAYTTKPWSGLKPENEVCDGVIKALNILESNGHYIEEARPEFDFEQFMAATLEVWCANMTAGADALAKFLKRNPSRGNLQSATWAFYKHGQTLTAADLLNALSAFNTVNRQFGAFFERYDVLVTPSCLTPAPEIGILDCNPPGEVDARAWNDKVFQVDTFMPVYNTTGQPAISLPLHQSKHGLPIGVQLASGFGDEATLFRLSALLEQEMPWGDRTPTVHAGMS